MAATVNITVVNTVAWKLTFSLTSNGEPWLVTGTRAKMQLRSSPEADIAALRLDSMGSNPTLFLEQSAIRIDVPASLALGVPPGAYSYDLLVFGSDEKNPTMVAEGIITVKAGVTR